MTPAQRTGAILAGLRLLERALDEYDGPSSKRGLAEVGDILTNMGAHPAPTAFEIDDLCEELNTQQPNRVVLTVEGGIVQNVGADRPEEVDVVVVDFDVDGSEHPSVIELPDTPGEVRYRDRAGVDHHEAQPLVPSESCPICGADVWGCAPCDREWTVASLPHNPICPTCGTSGWWRRFAEPVPA